jgi:hypothetical protein
MAGSEGVAITGAREPLDWGLAMGISTAPFAARKIATCAEGLSFAAAFTRRTLTHWGLDAVVDDTVCVVGELTAKVTPHAAAAGHDTFWLALGAGPRTAVCIARHHGTIPSRPEPLLAAPCRPSIEASATDWGWSLHVDGSMSLWARVRM